MFTKKLMLLAAVLVALTACQTGPTAQQLASTMVAQTAVAAPPSNTPSPIPIPSDTPLPPTITPTAAPTLSPTPAGPLVIKDDFSAKSDIWGKCDKCEWKDGKLYFGPFDPRGNGIDQVFSIVCVACGEHTYFHIAADLTFAAGVAGDREYGVGLTDPGKFMAGFGIAPSQFGAIEALDLVANTFSGKFVRYGSIKPGAATNRVEFTAKPSSSGGVDYTATINGKNISVVSDIIKRSTTGLKPSIYLGWHSVGITVDNFEYDEIVP